MVVAFPQTLLGTKVELFYDAVWNPLPPGTVRGVGAEDGEISIGLRGQPDESSGIVTTEAQLSINNQLGTYSPRNVASALYGKIGANTPLRISADVDSLIALADPFDTPGTNGWPTSPTGHAYTCTGGTAANFLVSGGLAYHQHTTTNVERVSAVANLISTDHTILLTGIQLEAQPTGNHVEVAVRSREFGTASWAETRIQFQTDNSIDIYFGYKLDGTTVNNASINTVTGLTTDIYNLRIEFADDVHRARMWKTSDAEPSFWHTEYSGLNMPPGAISVRSTLLSGVSNVLPYDITFQRLDVSFGIVLFHGEVSEWPQKWDSTGTDVWVPLTACGITRRLQQNAKPLRSALYRHYQRRDLTAYWSFENMQGTSDAYKVLPTDLTSSVQGGPAFWDEANNGPGGSYVGVSKWSDNDTLLGSDPLPTIKRGTSPLFASTSWGKALIAATDITDDAFSIGFWDYGLLNSDVVTTMGIQAQVLMANASHATDWVIHLTHRCAAGPVYTTEVSLDGGDIPSGAITLVVGPTTIEYIPKWRYYLFNFTKSGGNVIARIFVDGVNVSSGSAAVTTVGQPYMLGSFTALASANTDGVNAYGHLAICSGATGDDMTNNLLVTLSVGNNAYTEETATSRIGRLFNEEGYTIDLDFDPAFPTYMGPQGTMTFLESIEEAAKADDGVLFEQRSKLGYKYVSRGRLYNRSSQITLDYTNTDLGDVPEVTDDDQRTMNKFIAKRKQSGTSILVEKTTGPLSTNEPNESVPGAGTYDDEKTVNLFEDGQLYDYAAWRVHLGTWDESRWPAVKLALHRTPFSGNLTQLAKAAFLEIGDIFTVINTPEWLPPGDILLQMRAVKFFLSNFTWGLEWTALPAGPWQAGEASGSYEENASRLDTASSTLVTGVTDSSTELVLLTNETNLPWCDPLWTEDPDQTDMPHENGFDLRLNPQPRKGGQGGERVRSAANYSTQDTFTRTGQLAGSVANTGAVWVASTLTTSQPQCDGSNAEFLHAAANTEAFMVLPTSSVDGVVTTYADPSVSSTTGGTLVCHAVIRYIDASNYYAARLTMPSTGASTVALDVIKVVAGVTTVLSQPSDSPVTVSTGGIPTWIKIKAYGRDLAAKIWRSVDNEPEWQIELPDVATDNMTGTSIGIRTIRSVGNLTANAQWQFARIQFNTGRVRPYAYDYFNRTTVNGLGSAVVGSGTQAWTVYAVTAPILASDHQVTPNQATVMIPTVGAIRGGYLAPQTLLNAQVSAVIGMPLATGGPLAAVLFTRGTSIVYRLVVSAANAVSLAIFDTGGTIGTLSLAHLTHAAANRYRFKVYVEGNKIGAKVWLVGQNEPEFWQLTGTTVTTNTSFCGWFGQRDAGNTNVNPQLSFADFKINNPQRISVQRGIEGVSRAWDAGIDARLWTPARLAR